MAPPSKGEYVRSPSIRDRKARDVSDLVAALQIVSSTLTVGHDALITAHANLLSRYDDAVQVLAHVFPLVTDPPQLPADASIDEVDRAILEGLDRGVSRRNLPAYVGISKREFDDRHARMRRLARSETSFQLARAADALGWLPPARPFGADSDSRVTSGQVTGN